MTETCIFHLVDILGGLYTCHDTHYRGQKTIYEGWFSFSTVWVLGTELWSSGLLVNTFTYKGNSRALFCFFFNYFIYDMCLCLYVCVMYVWKSEDNLTVSSLLPPWRFHRLLGLGTYTLLLSKGEEY